MSELLRNGKSTNAFHWSAQPSQINWKNGKSVRQVLLDATRVNQYSDAARSTDSIKSQRISRASI